MADWTKSDDRNVFQMISDNGGPGLWIRRTTWGETCARIVGIGEVKGPAPYFGNPSLVMDVFDLSGNLKDELAWVRSPGTYKTWCQIEPPEWANETELRPLTDAAISTAISALDKRRGKSRIVDKTTKLLLTVPYARKEEAKALGAKWDPRAKRWWIAESASEETKAAAKQKGFLN